MLPKSVLFAVALVTLAFAKEEPFSIGLGVLSPSYSQTVGKEGVKVNYEQKDNGAFSFSIGDEARGVSHYHHLGGHAAKAVNIGLSPELEKGPAPAGQSGAHHPQPVPYASGAHQHQPAHYAPPAHQPRPVQHAPPAHHHQPVHYAPVHRQHESQAAAGHHLGHVPVAHHVGPAQHSFSQGLPKADGGYAPAAHHHHNPGQPAPAIHAFAFSTALGNPSAGAAHSAPIGHSAPVGHSAPAGHAAPAAPQPYNGVPQVTFYNSIGGHAFQTSHQVDGPARGVVNSGGAQGHGGYLPAAHGSSHPIAPHAAAPAAHAYNGQGFRAPSFQGAHVGQGGYGHGGRDHGGHSHEDLSQNRGHYGVQG